VIVLTAHDSEEARVEGMSAYLQKPINQDQLGKLLSRYVSVHPGNEPEARPH